MKKIFAILALAVSVSAFADSATIEAANVNNIGSADQSQVKLAVKHDFNKTYAGDVSITNTQTDGTNKLGTRLEAGVTASAPVGPVTGYVRTALGSKYSNTDQFSYYSVEPGVKFPVGPVTAQIGYRYRSATDSGLNGDQTHTARVGVSYALTKVDTVGVRFDRTRGDNTQNVTALNYTRGF
jgi:hypothetical protein